MKDIKDTVKCGVQILEFIQKAQTKKENAHKPTDKTYKKHYSMSIAKLDKSKQNVIGWKSVKVPDGNFFIFKDKYHGRLHVTGYSNMALCAAVSCEDYEDFNEDDIIAAFDTLKEAIIYIATEHGFSKKDIQQIESGDAGLSWGEKHKLSDGFTDGGHWMVSILNGAEDEEGVKCDVGKNIYGDVCDMGYFDSVAECNFVCKGPNT